MNRNLERLRCIFQYKIFKHYLKSFHVSFEMIVCIIYKNLRLEYKALQYFFKTDAIHKMLFRLCLHNNLRSMGERDITYLEFGNTLHSFEFRF